MGKKKEMEKERGKREPGGAAEQRFKMAATLTGAYFSTANYTIDSRWRATPDFWLYRNMHTNESRQFLLT